MAVDPSGSSVLDALGLPQGTINPNQSVDLTQQTTLRAGDSFQIQIEGVAPRTATITIGPGETYDSLVTKINRPVGQTGTAAVNYTGSAEDMTITANPGQTINLIAGPADFDALARLGIAAGVISAPAANWSTHQHDTARTSQVIQHDQADLRPGPDRHGAGPAGHLHQDGRGPGAVAAFDRDGEHPEHLSDDQRAASATAADRAIPAARVSGNHGPDRKLQSGAVAARHQLQRCGQQYR